MTDTDTTPAAYGEDTLRAMQTITLLLRANRNAVTSLREDHRRGLFTDAEALNQLIDYGLATGLPPSHPVVQTRVCYVCLRRIGRWFALDVQRWLASDEGTAAYDELIEHLGLVRCEGPDEQFIGDPNDPSLGDVVIPVTCPACAAPFGYRVPAGSVWERP